MRNIILGTLIILLMPSCLTVGRIQRNCDKFEAVCVTDKEKETVIEYRDTVIYIDVPVPVELPADTVRIVDTIPCPELMNLEPVTVEEGLVGATAGIKDNTLDVKAYLTDSLYIGRLQDSIRILKGLKQKVITKTDTITVKEDTKFGKFAKKWFFGTLILILILIGYLLLRFKVIRLN